VTWAALLLADRSPCLRRLVLLQLLRRTEDDPEVLELDALREGDPLAADVVARQRPDGSFAPAEPTGGPRGDLSATWIALATLGYLGFDARFAPVARGADTLLAAQQPDGSWPLHGDEPEEPTRVRYDMVPLQTALPLLALALCGYAEDRRCELAYDWLVAQRLDDGAWPTGHVAGTLGGVAGYRRLAHSRWGCRTNTTAALACLALHPSRAHGPEARRGLDLLLGRETFERSSLGNEVARRIGLIPTRGFLTVHAHFDLALVLDLCWRIGADRSDERVAAFADAVTQMAGPYGLWSHPSAPAATRWLSFDLLRSLSRLGSLGSDSDWVSMEPRTPFRPYPARPRRY
jgi:hypothetical protein